MIFGWLSCNQGVNRVRQYGLFASFLQVGRALIRGLCSVNRDLVFIIPGFSGYTFQDSCILPLTRERVARAADAGELSSENVRLLSGFLAEGSQGICAEIDGRLAGYAWVQHGGEYRFGQAGRITIPCGCAVAKNLFVFPEFRGRRLGRKLNEARLALISGDTIPVVLIIPENRYAIRNRERLGFQRVAETKQWRWLARPWHTKVRRLTDLPEAMPIIHALEGARHP